MKHIYILCQNYLDPELERFSIGGIETYLQNLVNVILEEGKTPIVIQYANCNKSKMVNNIKVIGVDITGYKHLRHINKKLYERFLIEYKIAPGILLFATEGMIPSNLDQDIYSIAIQHGISWDKPNYSKNTKIKYELDYWIKALINRIVLKKAEKIKRMVCVDYNYVNWYRAQVAYSRIKLNVIPNFTEIPSYAGEATSTAPVKIIFARRFFEYRGTRIFIKAIKQLLQNNTNIDITIVGTGPDEAWMKSQLPESTQVHYIQYQSCESLSIHRDKDIAVIPTIGSEGTSLSLLESMACGCAPVCTNVGGMTSIIIDGYNGLMVNPEEESLYLAIKSLIEDAELRRKISAKAYETVKEGFSYDIWVSKWKKIIKEAFCE